MAHKPTRLVKNRHGTYTYRFTVPKSLQSIFGAKHIVRSLHTKNFELARLLTLKLNYQIELMLIDMKPKITDFNFSNKKLDELKIQLPNGTVLDFDPSIKAEVDYVNSYVSKYNTENPTSTITKTIEQETTTTLLDVAEKWFLSNKSNAKTTQDKHKSQINHFIEYLKFNNITLINDVNIDICVKYVESLEAINSLITVTDKVINLKSYFTFAISRRYFKFTNPFEDIKLLSRKDKERIADSYQRFTLEEVKTIFDDSFNTVKKPAFYFIPLLALFTGARLEELAQLNITDIVLKDNIYCIHINEYNDKNIKNSSSDRNIPISKAVLDLGFIEYLELVKSLNLKGFKLFPNLQNTKNGYGKTTGDFFSKWLDKKNIKTDRKVFHSFRHTFNDELKEVGIEESIRCILTGHEHNSTNSTIYTDEYKYKTLFNIVEKLRSSFDTSKLKPFKISKQELLKLVDIKNERVLKSKT
jgi:integrase